MTNVESSPQLGVLDDDAHAYTSPSGSPAVFHCAEAAPGLPVRRADDRRPGERRATGAELDAIGDEVRRSPPCR